MDPGRTVGSENRSTAMPQKQPAQRYSLIKLELSVLVALRGWGSRFSGRVLRSGNISKTKEYAWEKEARDPVRIQLGGKMRNAITVVLPRCKTSARDVLCVTSQK